MTVEIDGAQRVKGRVVRLVVRIGDIKISYARLEGSDEYEEVSRSRDGVQVLDDRDGVYIAPGELPELYGKVNKAFSEDRSKSKPRCRKKRNFKVLQEKLF